MRPIALLLLGGMLTQGARAGSRPEQRQVQPGLQRSMGDVYQAVRLLVAANLSPKVKEED
ncbi:MAG: hypothetical protein DMG09_06595 [Acidobacteria bacterium]|nr:MAG: hypothetical protein DMG09_06595 [Acidobacteriota bacterium]